MCFFFRFSSLSTYEISFRSSIERVAADISFSLSPFVFSSLSAAIDRAEELGLLLSTCRTTGLHVVEKADLLKSNGNPDASRAENFGPALILLNSVVHEL